ncbi:hypothetical protein [Microbacterium sp. 77mftsu3.1]|uniref:hypothetical protein n=1 Tax=Microbacterium sp. 77mftsu3.1 TaxID=1761802 RepID=UPI00037EB0FE|nr:hypothetical protein [Microbacterium sp. 77mftsu3.1]SDH43593.1 hypothetical protein SAMN04488590_3341 [Microbacterium sp. 77mftsu3.1]
MSDTGTKPTFRDIIAALLLGLAIKIGRDHFMEHLMALPGDARARLQEKTR